MAKDTDWKVLLKKWRDMDHIGLTLHCLRALTGRPAYRLLAELESDTHTYVQRCYDQGAHVWCYSNTVRPIPKNIPGYNGVCTCGEDDCPNKNGVRAAIVESVKKFPPKRFRSIYHDKGYETTRLSVRQVQALRKVLKDAGYEPTETS